MNHDDARAAVHGALVTVAPDLDDASLTDDADLRYDLDLDSMDHLNFLVAVHEATGIEVPERDYAQLSTIGDCIAYVETAR